MSYSISNVITIIFCPLKPTTYSCCCCIVPIYHRVRQCKDVLGTGLIAKYSYIPGLSGVDY